MAETTMEPWSFTIVFDEDEAKKNGYEVDAQTLAISKLSRQKWVMQNIKSLAFREDDDEIYDGIETIRRVYPERVFDSESGE